MRLIAALLALQLASAAPAGDAASDPLEKARSLIRLDRLEEAENLLLEASAASPGDAELLVELGRLRVKRGDLAGAARSLEAARDLRPDGGDVLPLLAQVYLLQDRREEARAALERALVKNPSDAGSHYNLGRLLRLAGEVDPAVRELEQALALQPDAALRARIQQNLGTLYLDSRRYSRALSIFRALVRDQPEGADWRLKLAQAFEGLGEVHPALEEAREAARLKPDLAEAHRMVGSLLRTLGDLEGALAACQKAIEISPTEAGALALAATLHLDRGRPDQALELSRRLIERDPSHAQAHYLLGQALLARGEREAAEREFDTHRRLAAQRRAFQHTAASLGED